VLRSNEQTVTVRPKTPRVLVVEDNALIALDLEEILKNSGCFVVGPSMTVREAKSIVDREGIDVAIIDFILEDGLAGPLARYLDEKHIPYALCTGRHADELSAHFPRTPILGKPYNPDDVATVVNSLIASLLSG
jgi:DNA-binding NtrC family response regulator